MSTSPSCPRARANAALPLRVLLCVVLVAWATAALALTPGTAGDPRLPPHQHVWKQWTVEAGLPQITVTALVRDRDGYLWLGTQDGLARFDGLQFRHYGLRENPGLGHGIVTALGIDARGVLWIGTVGGVARMVDGRIESVQVPAPGTGNVMLFQPDAEGGMWVGTERGLLHARGDRAVPADPGGRTRNTFAAAVLLDAGRAPVAVTGFGLLADPLGAARWTPFDGLPRVISARRGPDGRLWVGTLAGLYRVDDAGRAQGAPLLPGREVTSIAFDADGAAWAGTEHGLWHIPAGGAPAPVVVPGLDADAWITSLLVDAEGTLWVGTQLSGLHRAYAGRFRRLLARDGLVDGAVWIVAPRNGGGVWAGTPQGLFRGGIDGFTQMAGAATLPNATVLSVLEDRAGTLWVGTHAGLARWPAGAARPSQVVLPDAGIWGLLQDDDGSLLVAASDGLHRVRDGEVERIELPGTGGGAIVTGIARGRDGAVWVGYNHGVAWRDAAGRWQLVPGSGERRMTSASLAPFDDGMLATGLETFFHADRRGVHALGTAQGLHVDVVHSARATSTDVWYQGPRGVGRIEAAQLRELLAGRRTRVDVRTFGAPGAAELAQCNGGQQDSAAITAGRWLWCPSLRGLLALDLARVDVVAPPVASRIQLVATPARRLEPRAGASLQLRAEEHDLQIDFAGMDLRRPERLRFDARLVGYDEAWKPMGARRSAYYTNLPGGEYRFEVRARNADGVPGPVAALPFSIAPRWHEMAAVRLGGLFLLLLGIWGLLRWRVAALNRRGAMLEERVRERTAQLEDANRRLEEASLTDALTGLHNRRFLLSQMPREIARVDRLHAAPPDPSRPVLALLHLDIDRFKAINDAHGHDVGDEVLRIAADRLRAAARDADFAVRWGGEEFVLVVRDIARADVPACARRMLEAFNGQAFDTTAGALRITCSVGYVAYPPAAGTLDWERLLQMADAATYHAKRTGRDRAVGIELLRADAPSDPDFGRRLHHDLQALADEGAIRVSAR